MINRNRAQQRAKSSSHQRVARRLRVESLEARLLMAGDTYLINFQFDEASIPTRYIRDVGALLAIAATA
jgi:hypothetical protein